MKEALRWVHITISNAKRNLLGIKPKNIIYRSLCKIFIRLISDFSQSAKPIY